MMIGSLIMLTLLRIMRKWKKNVVVVRIMRTEWWRQWWPLRLCQQWTSGVCYYSSPVKSSEAKALTLLSALFWLLFFVIVNISSSSKQPSLEVLVLRWLNVMVITFTPFIKLFLQLLVLSLLRLLSSHHSILTIPIVSTIIIIINSVVLVPQKVKTTK